MDTTLPSSHPRSPVTSELFVGGGRRPLGAKEGKADRQRVDGCRIVRCSQAPLSIVEKVGFSEKFYKIHLYRALLKTERRSCDRLVA